MPKWLCRIVIFFSQIQMIIYFRNYSPYSMAKFIQPELFEFMQPAKETEPEKLLYFPKDLLKAFDKHYSKHALNVGYYPIVRAFLVKNKDFCQSQKVSFRTYDLLNKRTLSKDELIRIAAIPFLTKDLFLAFRKSLDADVGKVLDEMVWKGSIDEKRLRKELKIEVVKPSTRSWRDKNSYLHNRFYVFGISLAHQYYPSKYHASLYLPDTHRKILIGYYDKPKDYYLHSLKSVKKTAFTFEGETVIGRELPRILIYISQGHLKVTDTRKPVISSVRKMKKALNLTEFYGPDVTNLNTLRSYLLANLILTQKKWENVNESLPFLKQIIKDYPTKFRTLRKLLIDLRGLSYVYEMRENEVESTLLRLLKEMPVGEWVGIDNILKFCNYRILNTSPVEKDEAESYVYYNVKKDYYTEKQYINDGRFELAIKVPVIKGTFFLFAAFGWVDIAYNTPNTSCLGQSYYSSYDGLECVRLNSLGAHLVKKSKAPYKLPHAEPTKPLSLSPDALMMVADENDQAMDLIVQNYAQKIGPNRYKVTYQSFLKDCRRHNDLKAKINLFKKTVTDKIPALWNAFFEELLRKSNPFLSVKPHKVMKLPDDRELIDTIARDSVLKNLVIKAEDYHIIVLNTNYPKFTARLRELGYLLDRS